VDDVYVLEAEVLKALGNPRRLEVFQHLCNGPVEVAVLVQRLGSSQSGISQHLAVLRAAGLVERERDGRGVRYRLSDPDYANACRIMRDAIRRRMARLAEASSREFGPAAEPVAKARARG
jgi:DNA-binding transcriptional ArsR family regulator